MLHKNLTNDHAPSQNLKSDHAPPKKNRNNHVPTKFEKRPCSTKIWEATMLHQKFWKATMLHQKMNMTVFHQNVTNGLKIWWNMVISQILVEHFLRPTCPQSRAFSKISPVPPKIWKMTMIHQNLRSDHAPSKNKNDRAPPKCDKWPQILVEHLIFWPACPQLRVFSKNDHVPPKFEKRPCSTKKISNDHVPPQFEKQPCSTKIWEATMLHPKINMTVFGQNLRNDHAPQKFEKRPCSIEKFQKWPC